ncbi:MAG: PQQ-binding-like beta-propeller repeat protein [Planctomycetaceae bacterium]|nr:PQQ-binding-like beta-propeller repeat protein [Planctomycetaceae bacterium]
MTAYSATSTFLLATAAALATLSPAQAQSGGASEKAADRVAKDVAAVEAAYLISPAMADKLGCRVAWQATVPTPAGESIRMVASSPAGVFALNTRNEVTLVRPSTGDIGWTASAGLAVDKILDLQVMVLGLKAQPRVVVLADTGVWTLDLESGEIVSKANLRYAPNTLPTLGAGAIIYGTRSGEVVWLTAATGFVRKAAIVDGTHRKQSAIMAMPTVGDGVVVAGSTNGTVAGYDAETGKLMWSRELLAGMTASAAIDNDTAFVASDDQYLYALDLGDGSTNWKYFTQVSLTTPPVCAGDMVLQRIPGEGLVAFAQDAGDNLNGVVRWKNQDVSGRPIALEGNTLVFWCNEHRRVTMVDAAKGYTKGSFELPAVTKLVAGSLEDGGYLAYGADGRIEKLSPVAKASPATAAAPADENADQAASNG